MRAQRAVAVMLLEGAGIIAAFLYPVWVLHERVVSRHVPETPLSLAIAFLVVQATVVMLQLLASCTLKWGREARAAQSEVAVPRIQQELAVHAAGEDRTEALRTLEQRYPRDFDASMESFLALVDGREKEVLSRLAWDLRLVSRWEKRARRGSEREQKLAVECLGLLAGQQSEEALWRLAGRSTPTMEATACRMLARSEAQEDAERLFGLAVSKPYLVRVLLAGNLRRHALTLSINAIPEAISGADEQRTLAALEMAASWRSALRLPDLPVLLNHGSTAVRAAALRVAPLNTAGASPEPYIVAALESDDLAVREAALAAVCQLRIGSTLPLLAHVASGESGELARLACLALSRLEPEGVDCLRTILLEGNPRAAACAAEYLSAQFHPEPSLGFA